MSRVGDDWRSVWIATLDALEADVVAVETLLADEHRTRDLPLADPWSPPEGLGPLPLDLRPRADGILARQVAAAQGLSRAMAGNRLQAAVASRLETGTTGPQRPSYVDCAM